MNWQPVIGLEVHVQLDTVSKIFSGAAIEFGAAPNTQACEVDLGLPGTLPVLNQKVVRMAIRFGLAINAQITRSAIFYRKNYFYPDLPKGYQISQLDHPIVGAGTLNMADGSGRQLNIVRAHLEEDAGKSLHEDMQGMTGIDLNRAGTPLLEIVTAPEIHTPAEAVQWLRRIHGLVCYLEICDGVMARGSLRCDANISVRPVDQEAFGERIEIKNLNSFRFVEQALNFEISRQIQALEQGQEIVRETRLYDSKAQVTRSMRSKEYAEDYRYFPEPDLLPLTIEPELIEAVRRQLPEMPTVRRTRYQTQYSLPDNVLDYLCQSLAIGDYFEAVVKESGDATASANWIMGELTAISNNMSVSVTDTPVTSQHLAILIQRVNEGILSSRMAKEVLGALASGEAEDVDGAISDKGLKQVSDTDKLQKLVTQIIADNPRQTAQYQAGKSKLLGFFVGQAMQATKGQANPKQLNELFLAGLASTDPDNN